MTSLQCSADKDNKPNELAVSSAEVIAAECGDKKVEHAAVVRSITFVHNVWSIRQVICDIEYRPSLGGVCSAIDGATLGSFDLASGDCASRYNNNCSRCS